MSNRFQVLLKDKNGIELDKWLRQKSVVFKNKSNLESLQNMRIFYVVKAAFEKNTNVYKIGISERGEHAAKGRLIDYVYSYGIADKNNTCKGVKIYLVLANYFNPDVTAANSYVRKLETRVKESFKEARDRGAERINVPIQELFDYLEENNDLFQEDTEIVTRKTPRLQEKGQAARDAVKRIVEEKVDRSGNVKYTVEFSSIAFKYDDDENQKLKKRTNETLTYEQIIQLPRGKQLLDEYITKNQNKTTTTTTDAKVTTLRSGTTRPTNVDSNISRRTRSGKITNI
tara:strand:+ start:4537 stop:5394 length:858 start_codon:yes stop_codon:yes gene_type:complete